MIYVHTLMPDEKSLTQGRRYGSVLIRKKNLSWIQNCYLWANQELVS